MTSDRSDAHGFKVSNLRGGHGWRLLSAILCACVTVGCDMRFLPEASRYQLTKDKEGRVLRLDTVTGEVTVAEPAPAVPVAPSGQRATSAAAAAAKVPAAKPNPPVTEVVASEPPRPLPLPADHMASAEVRPLVEIAAPPAKPAIDVCAREDLIRYVVTLSDVQLYIEPRRMQTPVATITSAVMLMTTERSGDWLLVRFDDARFGARVGYAHCSQLRALDINAVDDVQKSVRDRAASGT